MSVIKISELTAVETPDLSDVLPVVNQDETKAMTLQQVIDLAKANITILSIKVVNSTTDVTQENILYLVPASSKTGNLYNEYMFIDGKPEQVGSQEVDLSNYYTKEEVENVVKTTSNGRRIYNVEFNKSGGSDILGPNTLNQIGEMITNWYKTSERGMLMFASFRAGDNDGIRYSYIYQGLYTWQTGAYYDKTTGLNYQNKVFQFNKLSDNAGKVFDSVSIRIEGSWANDVYTCTKCSFTVGTDLVTEINNIKNNYAKTTDVETMITEAITGALEGSY